MGTAHEGVELKISSRLSFSLSKLLVSRQIQFNLWYKQEMFLPMKASSKNILTYAKGRNYEDKCKIPTLLSF